MIAAAGSGARLGAGGPKALVEVAGRPLIAWSLDALAAAATVEEIVIAAPPGYEAELSTLAPEAVVVGGGESRSASVGNALGRVESDLVAVHDAARPLVTAELVDVLVARLAASPDAAGVIAAAALTDTVKRSREPRTGADVEGIGPIVASTESRDHLWAAQTPQVFRAAALRDAHAADPVRVAGATDDASLVEQAGGTILIEPAAAANLKVTTPADIPVAAALLRAR